METPVRPDVVGPTTDRPIGRKCPSRSLFRSLRAVAGPDMTPLQSSVSLHRERPDHRRRLLRRRRRHCPFALTHGASCRSPPDAVVPAHALEETETFWREWSGRCRYRGKWHEAVLRSLITLKALTYRPTGGIVVAATTSLPEQPGGSRNRDYRCCRLQDSTFTMLSLIDAGYREEARAWHQWLLRAIAGSAAQSQVMYGVAGKRHVRAWEIDWLPGLRRRAAGARRQRGVPPAPARRVAR